MAVIGTIDSVFLAPGLSGNNRLYTEALIEGAVARMQDRLADPAGLPLTMLSHHAAGDDSKEIVGRIVSVQLDPATHEASLQGYLIDTAAGRDIAAAIETDSGGRRALDSMSIRGWWLGPVRVVDVDGIACETGDALEVDGVDMTRSPGVAKARLTSTARLLTVESASARTPIRESVEVHMSDSRLVHSTSTPTPADMPATAAEGAPGGVEAGEAKPASTAKGKAPYGGDTDYADPGLQSDKKARYPIDSAAHVRSAWSYINQADNQKPYTAAQVTTIKKRIKAAAKTYGVDINDTESSPTEPNPLAETIAKIREARVAIGGWQGPVDIDLSAWGLSNDDVAAAAATIGSAYTAALRVLDPDNDNDLDLPGGEDVEEQPCGGCGAAVMSGANYCPVCGEPVAENAAPAAAPIKESSMSDTTTDQADVAAAAARKQLGLPAEETAPAAAPATETAPAKETAPAPVEAPAAAEAAAPATETTAAAPAAEAASGGHVTLTLEEYNRLRGGAPAPATETVPVKTATTEADFAAAVKAAAEGAVEAIRKEMLEAYGPPSRKGLVEAAQRGANPDKALHTLSPAELNKQAAAVWNTVLGDPGA